MGLSQALFLGLAAEAVECVIRLIGEGFLDWIPPSLVVYIAGLDFLSPSPDDKPIYLPWRTAKKRVRGGQNKSIKAEGKSRGVPQDPCRIRALAADSRGLVPQGGEGQPREEPGDRFPSLGIPCGRHIWKADFS